MRKLPGLSLIHVQEPSEEVGHLAQRSSIILGIWAKTLSILLLLGVYLSEGESRGGAESGGCVAVKAQVWRCRPLREVWSWALADSKGSA